MWGALRKCINFQQCRQQVGQADLQVMLTVQSDIFYSSPKGPLGLTVMKSMASAGKCVTSSSFDSSGLGSQLLGTPRPWTSSTKISPSQDEYDKPKPIIVKSYSGRNRLVEQIWVDFAQVRCRRGTVT
ncbi:hypothetical protein HGM15179_009669 [Zosterops borbonicus]|uniref:Uncharacterized protein n=1 Tax=Zosterops borbonicus TaxID=364589 RepID=A0A8K1GET0_9PASS|nr:hypothetical protein HGM15179_009669 [Zosterops borbonicus]